MTYPAVQVQCAANTSPVTLDKKTDTAIVRALFMSAEGKENMTLHRMA